MHAVLDQIVGEALRSLAVDLAVLSEGARNRRNAAAEFLHDVFLLRVCVSDVSGVSGQDSEVRRTGADPPYPKPREI